MLIGRKLAAGGERLQRTPFPDAVVARNQVEDRRLQDEEAAVDEGAVAGGLLLEGANRAPLDFQRAVAAGRLDGGDGRLPGFPAVEGQRGGDVDVADAVAVGEEERAVEVLADPAQDL